MNVIMSMLTAALYAVFLRNLLFSGGLGASEVIRAAQRNSEIVLTSVLVSVFSAATAGVCWGLPNILQTRHSHAEAQPLSYPWMALIYGAVLITLYLIACGVITLVPLQDKRLLLKRMGMSVLNALVISVPLLSYLFGYDLPAAIGLGLGAGLAFYIVTMLINSGMHILQQNKAIPSMFTGVPAALIYTGLLALAFTGFTGEILFA